MNADKLYKTELHCHTGDVSTCGYLSAEEIRDRYLENGYSTVVVTDHFNRINLFRSSKYLKYLADNDLKTNWQTRIDHYIRGYENLKRVSEGQLNVLLGIEFQSWTEPNRNDYLIYGVTEEWLRASECITKFGYKEMAIYAHEFGLKIYQAHPFRKDMVITEHAYLDGIEVYNATVNVNSNNDFAELWADRHGLKKISGSDFHESIHKTAGGILTSAPITSNEQLLKVLDSGDSYELIRGLDT